MNATQNTNTDVAVLEGSFERRNAAGKSMGSRVSFIQSAPAGDIRKALKAENPQLTNKKLKALVLKVVKGESTLAVEAGLLVYNRATKAGFVPVLTDMNKAEDKLVMRFQRFGVNVQEATEAAKALTIPQMEAILAAKREEEAAGATINVQGQIQDTQTDPAVNGADAADTEKEATND